jgi:Fe2+ or Zn2+ uptake regulation protein
MPPELEEQVLAVLQEVDSEEYLTARGVQSALSNQAIEASVEEVEDALSALEAKGLVTKEERETVYHIAEE